MNDVIEAMRERVRSTLPERRLTTDEVRAIVSGLVACHSLEDIEGTSGLDKTSVLDVVAELGTWLTHVRGGTNTVVVTAAELSQQPLFQGGNAPKANSASTKTSSKKLSKTSAKAPAKAGSKKSSKAKSGPAIQVVLPVGFERSAPHRRDVARALAAIVVADLSDDIIVRFLARKYPSETTVLTFPIVAALWRFATLGRLDDMAEISPHLGFQRLLVAAWDLLEVARQDSADGIKELIAADVSDLDALRDACAKSRFVAEGELTRIERQITMAHEREAALPLLSRELSFLAQRVRANPMAYLIGSIAELSEGQVRRIAQAAGLPVDGESRAEEAEIRSRLQQMGLSSDVDRLVPEGVRASQVGVLETFWDACERRLAGDQDWDQSLRDAFEQAGVQV